MIYKANIRKISSQLILIEDKIFYIDDENNFCIDGEIFLKGNYSISYSIKNKIALLDENNFKTILINAINNKIENLDYVLILLNDTNGIFLSNENKKWNIIRVIKKNSEIINNKFDLNLINKVLDNNTFLSKKENNLSCHQLENAEKLWRLDVSKLGEYLHLKGTEHEELRAGTVHELYNYNTILVALLRNDTIIGIDSATGAVLWQKPLFLFISRPVELNDKLYHIITGVDVKNMLQVYDLATGKLEREVEITHPVLKENTFFTKRFINDTYIALTATKTGEILVINHKTAIVENYAKLPNLKEKIPIDNIPQVHQNKVYQLDGEGTLHIFEKEESI
tara:strand:+ start:931 stop:1944 length:1014 start_codon:yes stop_codon:yes gene_type:complete